MAKNKQVQLGNTVWKYGSGIWEYLGIWISCGVHRSTAAWEETCMA